MARLEANLHELLNEENLKALFLRKIFTIIDFIDTDIKIISNVTQISYRDILDIRNIIIEKHSAKLQTGVDIYEDYLKNVTILPTHIKNLDKLLNGGIETNKIYELCGYASSGKTQLCLTLAVNYVQYLQKSVLYIDTKRDFSGKRLQNILNSKNICEEMIAKICNEIKIKEINNRFELINVLHEIKEPNSSIYKVNLVIIDSLPSIFYHAGDLNNSLTIMNQFTNIMRYLCIEKNKCFVITNILLQNQGLLSNEPVISGEKPGLGSYWSTVPHCRLKLSKVNDCCNITLLKSKNLPNSSCQVQITNSGVS